MTNDVPRVWYMPPNGAGQDCLIFEANGVKRYQRFWYPGTTDTVIEWGWTLPDNAIELVPKPPETS